MERKGFIGGSDMRRIMEGKWIPLWEQKTGRSEPDDLSNVLPVQLGSYTEEFNLNWFAKEHECELVDQQREYGMNWYGVPLKGQIDSAILGTEEMIEAKHTYDRNDMQSCLEMYMPQMQFYMWVADKKGCNLSVIFGNRRWESVYVRKDWDYLKKMQVHLNEFWRHVTEDMRPFGDDQIPPVSIDKIAVDGMTRRDATSDNEFISRCHDYIEQEANAKLFESAKADLKAMVASDEREVYSDLLTIKRDKRGSLRITIREN